MLLDMLRPSQASPEESIPVPETSPEGVDLSLIRWMLSLTPTQRLETLQGFIDSVEALRHGRRS